MWQIAVVGQPDGMMFSRERLTVPCMILLIIFQRARSLNEEDWTSAAWIDFLSAVINL